MEHSAKQFLALTRVREAVIPQAGENPEAQAAPIDEGP